jgi:hypothetical protein
MKELLTSNSAFHIALTDINKGHNLETHWRGKYVLNNAILLFKCHTQGLCHWFR